MSTPFLRTIIRLAVSAVILGWSGGGLATEPEWKSTLEKELREATAGDSAGVAVLVARDGEILFEAGFGLADLESKAPVTPQTKFRIGSVTKQFTAAAVLKLCEEGRMSLDDTLAKYFPEFPNGASISIRQLLTHTSGLHSYTEKPEFKERVKEAIEPTRLIDWFKNDLPDFAPGAGFHYNNSAYFLAGEIVAQASGKPLGEYLREVFFDPLGMKDTGVYVNASPPEGMARGYSFSEEKFAPAVDWDMSWAGGAGALYSTVRDLHRWNEALHGGSVVSKDSLQAAITPVTLPEGVDGMKYGLGLTLLEVNRLPAIGHGGGLDGWSSILYRLPQQNASIVVLANALPAPPKLSPGGIARSITGAVFATDIQALPPLVEDTTVDPKTFADYVGRYDIGSAILNVFVEGESLMVQLTDQPKFQIFPKAKDVFFLKVVDAELTFLRDDEGKVTAVRNSQNGAVIKALKLGDEKVKLTPEQAAAFAGKYQYGVGAVLTVTSDGSQLFAQLTGQPKFPIFPVAENEFEWRVVQAKVQFVAGDDGKIVKAVHHQNGVSFEAPKTE